MTFTTPQNPWGLTQSEVETMDAMAQTGNTKLAARIRDRAHATVQAQLDSARHKMEMPNQLMAVLTWDRLRRAA